METSEQNTGAVLPFPGWVDLIDSFMAYTDGIPSPVIFRQWCAIATIAGALERRVWVQTARSKLFPNLFTLLVSPPGIGKSQSIAHVSELWYGTRLANGGKFYVAPNNVTKAALVDQLAKADRKIMAGGTMVEYHSLLVASSEFGVLVPAHDLEFLSVLNDIYDNPRAYRESRRTLGREIDIVHPQLNLLAGTQPGFLASLLPEEAWSMGFLSRIILVYAGTTPAVDLFDESESREPQYKALIKALQRVGSLMGVCVWTGEAQDAVRGWVSSGCAPVPEHSKLQNYIPRRVLHLLKLCIVSAVSRSGGLTITLADVTRAKDWLLHAEELMPDVFRDMAGKSDGQVIADLHFFMFKIYIADKKPIHEARIWDFLKTRVPSEKIFRIIDACERSGVISRLAGTGHDSGKPALYIPKPRHEHGME